jgi:D-glucosaminate-6-phosphate ammonia-lyase
MSTVYDRLGVTPIINACGPNTRLSGGIMAPAVADAMAQASQYCVDMVELQARASVLIAAATSAEAGLVTSGAAAGLLLGLAATMTGLDPDKMNRLPATAGLKNQIIVPRSHRNFYDRAARALGAEVVEVGLSDRFSGTGVRDCEAWEIGAAVTERTAGIYYLAKPHSLPALPEVVQIARGRGIPVVVDAAAELPPIANLRRFTAEGADLVVFSGGKAIGGPQASGILAGRRDLIAAAALQNLDLDVFFDFFNPPPEFIDKRRLPGLPQHGIGRPCKVGKEEIVGLLTALRLFIEEEMPRMTAWRTLSHAVHAALLKVAGLEVALCDDPRGSGIAIVAVRLRSSVPLDMPTLVRRLENGNPRLCCNLAKLSDGVLLLSPVALRAEQVPAIAIAFQKVLADALP